MYGILRDICMYVCIYLNAAVINCHILSGLKQQNVFSYDSGSQKSKIGFTGLKSRLLKGYDLEALGVNSPPCLL